MPKGEPVAPGPAATPAWKAVPMVPGKPEALPVAPSPGVVAMPENMTAIALKAVRMTPMEFAPPRPGPAVTPMVGPRGGGGACVAAVTWKMAAAAQKGDRARHLLLLFIR